MKNYFLLLVFSIMLCINTFAQQEPQFNQYQFNQLLINPAFAGSKNCISTTIIAKQQMIGFDGAPKTQSFSIHSPLKNKKIGLGLSAYSEQVSFRKTTAANLNFAYTILLNNKLKLSFGTGLGIINYNFDWSKATFKDDENFALVNSTTKKTTFNANGGIYIKSNSMFSGISISQLNKPSVFNEVSFPKDSLSTQTFKVKYTLNPHLFFIVSKGFSVTDNIVLNPSVLIKASKKAYNFDLNLNVLLVEKFWIGVFYKNSSSIGFLSQYLINDKFKVGYSFSSGIGRFTKQFGTAHEIMIGFDFTTNKSKILSPRTL